MDIVNVHKVSHVVRKIQNFKRIIMYHGIVDFIFTSYPINCTDWKTWTYIGSRVTPFELSGPTEMELIVHVYD